MEPRRHGLAPFRRIALIRGTGDMPATASRFGRAPGAWPLLGHVVALQRRPLALLDSLPAHGDLAGPSTSTIT
jgi:hypothetical protein